MNRLCLAIALIGSMIFPGICRAQAVDDPFSDYLQRSDSIALSAGNAQNANEAVQTINPWPPYAWDRHITTDGRHAVDSIERMYRTPDPFGRAGASAAPAGSSVGANGTPSTSPAAPMQPVSGGE
jgi:hypothetical protein